MKPFVFVVLGAVAFAGLGCNRQKSDSTEKIGSNSTLANPKITIARGCLTGSGDQFVLTSLDYAAPASSTGQPVADTLASTDSYRLVGMTDQLKGLVGQRIEVTGDSAPAQVVDLVSATPSGNAVGTAGADPKVSTASRARVEIYDLNVSSVHPLGDKCP
jgi:hypothetical protein